MHSGADLAFFEKLAELNVKFGHGLPHTLGRLAAARAAFDPASPPPELVEQFLAVLHTLAGSSATFGFHLLGQQARTLEQRLRVLTTFDHVGAPEWTAWLDELAVFVAWGLRDPKAAYPDDESAT